jgi:hypothetical protein
MGLVRISNYGGRIQLSRAIGYWLVGSVPLFAALGPFAGFGNSFFVFRFVALTTVIWAFLQKPNYHAKSPPERVFSWFVIAFIYLGTVSLLWTPVQVEGSRELLNTSLCLLTAGAVIKLSRGDRNIISSFSKGWLVGFVLTGCIAIWELLSQQYVPNGSGTGIKLLVASGDQNSWVASTFYNPNDYAGYLLVSFPIVFSLLKGRNLRLPRLIFVLAWSFLLWNTDSRTATIASTAIVLLWIGYSIRRMRSNYMIFGTAIFALLMCLFIVVSVSSAMGMSSNLTSTVLPKFSFYDSDQGRVALIDFALSQTVNSWGFGRGAGAINALALDSDEDFFTVYGITDTHNMGAEIVGQYGIVVFALLVWTAATVIASGFAAVRKGNVPQVQYLGLRILALSVGLLAWSFASSSTLEQPVFWLAAAMAIVFSRETYDQKLSNGSAPGLVDINL